MQQNSNALKTEAQKTPDYLIAKEKYLHKGPQFYNLPIYIAKLDRKTTLVAASAIIHKHNWNIKRHTIYK